MKNILISRSVFSIMLLASRTSASPVTKNPDPTLICGFTGDSDTYGLGVRLGMYLQWIATFLATAYRLESARSIRTANTTFQLANFVGLFLFTFHRPQVYAIEPLIVLFVIFGAAWFFILVAMNIEGSINEAILRVALYTAVTGYAMWYLWWGMDGMIQPDCGSFAFFFARVNLFGWFRILGKVLSVIVSLIFMALWIFHVPKLVAERYPRIGSLMGKERYGHEDVEGGQGTQRKVIIIKNEIAWILSYVGLVSLAVMIVGAELMISWNHIGGVYKLDSTGQLIPAFLGFVLLWTTIAEMYQGKRSQRRGVHGRQARPAEERMRRFGIQYLR
jgi:hypothetical protein